MHFIIDDLSETPFRDIPIEAKREAWREIREGEEGFNHAVRCIQEAVNAHDREQTRFWQFVFLVWAIRLSNKPDDFEYFSETYGCYHEVMTAWAYAAGMALQPEDEKEAERQEFAKWLEAHGERGGL